METSVIGFGTWPIGGARYGRSDDAEAIAAIHAAFDAGVTCFDTAPSYGSGHAEEVLGRALSTKRKDVLIATKGGLVFDDRSFITGQDSSFDHLQAELERSLSRLQTDYVDLFLIHWPDPEIPIQEIAGNLDRLVVAGKTRAAGVSNCTASQIDDFVAGMGANPLIASQVGLSLFDRRWENETFATCENQGIGVMAYGPLAHGLLTGAISHEDTFDDSDWRSAGIIFGQPLFTADNRDANLDVIDRLGAFARTLGATLPQVAIAWVLAHDPVTVALVGARSSAEITDSVTAAELQLNREQLQQIDEIMQDAQGMTDTLPAGGTSKATTTTGDGE